MSFIKGVREVAAATEIPDQFALWAAISAVSATLGRSVSIHRGHFKLYPNFYTVLLGESGVRKSAALDIVRTISGMMPEDRQLNVVADRATTEAMVDEMRGCGIIDEGNVPRCQGFGMYDELVGFLNEKSNERGLGTLLCGLHGCPITYRYRTRGRGDENLSNVWFGFLGAATPSGVREFFTRGMVEGGLASRMIFIKARRKPEGVAIPPDQYMGMEKLSLDLTRLSIVKGSVNILPETWRAFEADYNWAYKKHPLLDYPQLGGYLNRRDGHMLKLATIVGIDETRTLTIQPRHLDIAKGWILTMEEHLKEIFDDIESSDHANQMRVVMEIIKSAKEITRSDLLNACIHKLKAADISESVRTLEDAGYIYITQPKASGGRPPTVYIWKDND